MASELFLKLLVAAVIIGMIIHFMFHSPILLYEYFSLFSASLYVTFLSADFAASVSMHIFLFSIIITGLCAVTFTLLLLGRMITFT